MKQILFILLFFCGVGVKAQYQDEKELSSFFSYIIDSIISENNPDNDTILIRSKTNESLYKYCDPDLEKFISFTFSESDKTDILNGLRTAQPISLYDIICKNKKVKLTDSITNDWLQTRVLRDTYLICHLSTPVFISVNRCIFVYDISGLGGEITLFKKEESKWSIDKVICEWYE